MTSPTDKDILRIAEILKQNYNEVIEDKESFDRAYDDYMESSNGALTRDNDDGIEFSNNVFEKLKDISRGKFREQKREQLAPITEVKALKEKPIRGYGEAKRVPKAEKRAIEFNYAGKEKGRIVYARRIQINTRYGKQYRYIDNKGRYVGVLE